MLRFSFFHLQTLASLIPYSAERGRFLRLKPLATAIEKETGKKLEGELRSSSQKELDDVPCEGFSEFDPAVLALEEADQHVLL
jgi:hypothetical protein